MAQPSAYENVVSTLPGGEAAGDLSADQFKFMAVDSAAQVAVNTALGGPCDGVLQTKPAAQGNAATVWGPGSVSKVVVGAAVAIGDLVSSDAAGKAKTAASGEFIMGRAMSGAAADGELIAVWLTYNGVLP